MKDYLNLSPEQFTGKEIIAESIIECVDEKTARHFFKIIGMRLLNVKEWHQLAGWPSAKFQAFDVNGNQVERLVQQGDYLRVDIPGPGSAEGHGYEWVKIESLKELNDSNIESIGFRVRPTAHPHEDQGEVAHFYDKVSTSSFIVTRKDASVAAMIIDRNIKPNDNVHSITGKLRNTPVALFAINMFSKAQWQHLASGLVTYLE